MIVLGGIMLISPSIDLLAEEKAAWAGGAELGFVSTSGNTDTQTFNFKLDITQELSTWRNNARLDALNTSEDEMTSAEKYVAAWKSDYKFTSSDYFFGSLQYDDDRFSGFDYQVTLAAGYGRRLLETESSQLDVEIGPGFLAKKVSATQETEDEAILRLAGAFKHQLSDTADFSQNVTIDAGEDTTISRSVTGLQAQVSGKLAMKLSYTIKHTSEVPAETSKTDRETAVTMVYQIQ